MFTQAEIENLLFFDVETAPAFESFDELTEVQKKHWAKREKRSRSYSPDAPDGSLYSVEAGIPPEFSRVVCISCGIVKFAEGRWNAHIKSFSGEDEKHILEQFALSLNKFFQPGGGYGTPQKRLCGHNIKEFDVPMVARRMMINRMFQLPDPLKLYGKKPWEIPHVDTMELWKFGDSKSFTGLELLTDLFEIPSPKTDMDGSMVGAAFWQDKAYEKISEYCALDVGAVMNLVLRWSGFNLIEATH